VKSSLLLSTSIHLNLVLVSTNTCYKPSWFYLELIFAQSPIHPPLGALSVQMPIMPDIRQIGRVHQRFVSFREDPWYLGFQRNKTLLFYPPPRPSVLLQDIVVYIYSG
jgi:hypothetical protein